MKIIITILLFISLVSLTIGLFLKRSNIYIGLIHGIMLGCLFNVYLNKEKQREEYYIQVALFVITFNVEWNKKIG